MIRIISLLLICLGTVIIPQSLLSQDKLKAKVDALADDIEKDVIAWRRHIHQNPELSNREFQTAEMIAAHLKSLGIEVQTGVAHTGVVGLLKGGKPGPVVALRADMDALPVTERVDVPYASKVKATYNGQEVGVMHACGHDTHVAILMGVAQLFSGMRKQLPGTIKFIFQPAEEGAPKGEEGGAELMVKEGVMTNPTVDAVFGLHISSGTEVGQINYRPGGAMASADGLEINVKGKQTHGARPWGGADPIVASAQIIMGLQTIVSRRIDLTENAAVVTIGGIHGGVRGNIIPEEVKMIGTIRALHPEMQKEVHELIHQTVTNIAAAAGVEAEVIISRGYPVTYNNPTLTAQMLPTLQEAAGAENVNLVNAITGAEDFSFLGMEAPGLFIFLGGMPKGTNPSEAAPHHTPDFFIDDSGLKLGVRTLSYLTLDYMRNNQ
ncbi:MAG: amidohydrolase [Bacteroidota bacterium]